VFLVEYLKKKIKNEVKNSLDEIEQAFKEWKTDKEWIKKAYDKFHEIIDKYNNNKFWW